MPTMATKTKVLKQSLISPIREIHIEQKEGQGEKTGYETGQLTTTELNNSNKRSHINLY